ncbi:protein ANTAGONIST OF LIKE HETEROCHROMATIN PROTEIN 1 [Kryptolebias marmoratus]|uniref:Protein ANTAGONIST OF LIKE HETEROCHROMATIN PROTEIN 1-like n=1 Tax=Kryptolebias marmoratus TaxID=37003 RepID=A0A3Q2ZMH7_KRYMA|nr:protein ANTAGONIST OF LIKE HETEROCHROMATIN PROTEIN 1 [Kryptolebias marmoratus]
MNSKQALVLTLLLLDSNVKTRERKMRKKKRLWTRSILGKRGQYGMPVVLNEPEVAGQNRLKDLLCMNAEQFNHLLQLVTPYISKQNTHLRPTISARERLFVTLRYLVTGESFVSLSCQYHIGRSTISGIVKETCEALYLVLKDNYLKTPTTEAQWREVALGFQERCQFPHCVGAVDEKHINIRPPGNSGSTLSLVLLAVVNASYQFLYAHVETQGGASDSGVFAHSDLRTAVDRNLLNLPPAQSLPGTDVSMPYVFVTDEAFPLQPNLMKAYPFRQLDHDQRIFNYRLSRASRVAENAFGILSNRWQIFLSIIPLNPDLVSQITLAALSLHNYLCDQAKDTYTPPSFTDSEDEAHNIIPGSWRSSPVLSSLTAGKNKNTTRTAKQQRDTLKAYFVSPAGSVPWQEEVI